MAVAREKKKALLFVNIGTPEELSEEAVKRYLKKFLMDKYVIDIFFLFRWILVNLIIVPFRTKKSLAAYKEIWKNEGSPLEVYTKALVKKAKKKLPDFEEVTYAMSYSKPFIEEALEGLKKKDINEVYYLPLYPQYAESTARSSLEEAKKWHKKNKKVVVKSLSYFYEDADFVKASVQKIESHLADYEKEALHFLFSFHGLPERHVKKLYSYCRNDRTCCLSLGEKNRCCYRAQCFKTAEILARKLGFKDEAWSVSFQSRLGRDKWLMPYTSNRAEELAQKELVKNLVVIPWAFTIDCLETEEELDGEIKEAFLEAGGKSFKRIPCLNQDFADVLGGNFLSQFKDLEEVCKKLP